MKLLKPLTRRSIKPTRLFQTEEQKQAREADKAEEEVTDIEEGRGIDVAEPTVPAPETSGTNRRSRRTAATKSTRTPNGNSTLDKVDSGAEDVNGGDSPTIEKTKKPGKGSPFDSWKRMKPGSGTAGASPNKGRKRTSSGMGEGEQSTMTKKLRNR